MKPLLSHPTYSAPKTDINSTPYWTKKLCGKFVRLTNFPQRTTHTGPDVHRLTI